MQSYYHWHPNLFKINEIISAGHYGSLLERVDKFNNLYKYEQEMQLEKHRKLFFNCKPSRLNSIFLLSSLEDALLYKKQCEIQSKLPYDRNLYTVKIINNTTPIHIGSTSLFNGYFLRGLSEKASRLYWSGEKCILTYDNGFKEPMPQEIIVESDIRVLEIIFQRNSRKTHSI